MRTRKETVAPKKAAEIETKLASAQVPENVDSSPSALEMRATQGDLQAAFTLYEAYRDGDGVPASDELAMEYLRRAAEGGLPDAQFDMSHFAHDPAEALGWARRAADAGHIEACLRAGWALLKGRGVDADPEQALKYLNTAAEGGNENAVNAIRSYQRRRAAEVNGEASTARALLVEYGLAEHAEAILALRLPSIRIVAKRADQSVPVGASKLGGDPDLPEGMEWPSYQSRPLSFLAQIDLQAVAPHDQEGALPRAGVLSFFFDTEGMFTGDELDAGRTRVYYCDPKAALVRRKAPDGAALYAECGADFFREATLPFARTAEARSLGLEGLALARYKEFFGAVAYDVRRLPTADGEVHRLLGHPDAIQGDMARCLVYGQAKANLDAPRPALEEEASHWKLLLQIDSDSAANMMWGDLGRVYFWIRDDALADRRFDTVYALVQGG